MEKREADLSALRIEESLRDNSTLKKRTPVFLIFGLLLIFLLGLTVVMFTKSHRPESAVQAAPPVVADSIRSEAVLSAAGYVVTRHKINVGSKVSGRIASVEVEKGDKVKEGKVLVRLEDAEFRAEVERWKGTVAAAEAELAASKLKLGRAEKIFIQKGISDTDLDDAKMRLERARGGLAEARGQLAYAQALLEATEIRAPITGTVLERTAEKGEMVSSQFATGAEGAPRTSVVTLADLTDLQVELDISQSDFARLSDKQRGSVTVDAFPGRKYDGVVSEISPTANRQKATVQVKVRILNPDEFLRPEMNAKVTFLESDTQKEKRATASPLEAIREHQDGRDAPPDSKDRDAAGTAPK